MLRRLWQWRHSAADSPTEAPLAEAYKGLVKFKPSKAEPDSVHTFDVVFLPELTEGRDESSRTEAWPLTVLPKELPEAKITVYGYDITDVKGLGYIFDQERLRQCAEDLLNEFALFESSRPIMVFAHGFGGLIYERAVVMSVEKEEAGWSERSGSPKPSLLSRHAAFLLDTPHFGAGLAEWAIMCARRLRIATARTAQQQDWTKFNQALDNISIMQATFQKAIRESTRIRIGGCFATRPGGGDKLMLSPEWTILPDFEVIAVTSSHFEMTRLQAADKAMGKAVTAILNLSRMWVDELLQRTGPFKPSGYDPRKAFERVFERSTDNEENRQRFGLGSP